jgi:hypothetical protein
MAIVLIDIVCTTYAVAAALGSGPHWHVLDVVEGTIRSRARTGISQLSDAAPTRECTRCINRASDSGRS